MPAPQRQPVECWQPIQRGSERAFDFMAKYGIGGGSAEGGAVERHMRSAVGRIVRRPPFAGGRLANNATDRICPRGRITASRLTATDRQRTVDPLTGRFACPRLLTASPGLQLLHEHFSDARDAGVQRNITDGRQQPVELDIIDPDRQNVLVASLLKCSRLGAAGLLDRPLAVAVLLRNKNDAEAGSFAENFIERDSEILSPELLRVEVIVKDIVSCLAHQSGQLLSFRALGARKGDGDVERAWQRRRCRRRCGLGLSRAQNIGGYIGTHAGVGLFEWQEGHPDGFHLSVGS